MSTKRKVSKSKYKDGDRIVWLAPDGKEYQSTIHIVFPDRIIIWVQDSVYSIKESDIMRKVEK